MDPRLRWLFLIVELGSCFQSSWKSLDVSRGHLMLRYIALQSQRSFGPATMETTCLDLLLRYLGSGLLWWKFLPQAWSRKCHWAGPSPAEEVICSGLFLQRSLASLSFIFIPIHLFMYPSNLLSIDLPHNLSMLQAPVEGSEAYNVYKKVECQAQRWWRTPLIPALGRQRQANPCEFEASLVYKS